MRRRFRRASAMLIATCGVLALGALGVPTAGAGPRAEDDLPNGPPVTPEEWTASFCTGVVGYYEDYGELSKAVGEVVDASLEEQGTTLERAVQELEVVSADLRDALEAAGSPDVPSGNETAGELIEGLQRTIEETKKIGKSVEKGMKARRKGKRAKVRRHYEKAVGAIVDGELIRPFRAGLDNAQRVDGAAGGMLDAVIRQTPACQPLFTSPTPASGPDAGG